MTHTKGESHHDHPYEDVENTMLKITYVGKEKILTSTP
jgi:hypothetical protein